VKKIVELDATEKFDILHAQFAYPPGIAALLAGKALKKPVVVSIQGGDGHWFGTCCNYHRQLMKTLLRNSQALIIGTASFAQEVRENNNEDPKFVILPGATNVEQFHSWNSRQRANMREKYGIPVAKRVILSHGRLDWRKGIGELLEAFVLLHERDKEIHLVFAGVGPDEDALQARVRDMNLVPYISFLGYVDYADTPEVYALGDIFCSPTYAEGFSNTIVEALASGLPVVSTNVVGVRDVLVDGETALLVEARDPKSLEAVLRTLLDDDTTRNRLINNGHEAVNRLWSWKNLAMKLEQVYSSVRTQIPQHSWSLDSCGNPKAEPCRFREAPNLL